MTYKPIPEERRRELAPLVAELSRKFKSWLGAPATSESENYFWQRVDAPGVSPDELVWLIRQARSAAGCIDPVQITNYTWPKRCCLTGPRAHREGWPLEPIPDEPQAQPTPEGPLVDGTPVKEGDVLYYVGDYKPFIGAEIIVDAGSTPVGGKVVRHKRFTTNEGRDIPGGWLRVHDLSRTKPVIIEGRVVKPGDVLYYGPTTPNSDIVGQQRVVHKIVGQALLFVNGATCGSPKNMTYVKPDETRKPKTESLLGAPYGPSAITATQRLMEEKNRFLRACLDDADYLSRLMNRIPSAKLEGAIHDELNFSVPRGVDLSVALESLRPRHTFIRPSQFFDPAVISTSITKEKHTMNQATPANAHALTVDTSNIVEVKTFVFGRDIATLDDDTLLNYVQSLTGAIEHLEQLNLKTPLAKLVTKIAQLKDAKAKIVDLLGGAPVQADSDGGAKGSPNVEAQPRKRRTKAEMEADAQQGGATPSAQQAQSKPVPPAPPAPTQPEPSVADVDLDD